MFYGFSINHRMEIKMQNRNDIKLKELLSDEPRIPVCVPSDSSYSIEDSLDVLCSYLENGVRLYLPTSVFRYLALKTPYDAIQWEMSPAKLKNK